MLGYVTRRTLLALPATLGVCTVLFFALHAAPGSPEDHFIHPDFPPDVADHMRHNLGLDQPLPVQYGKWLVSLLRLDFGHSFFQQRPVLEILGEALPNTLVLCGVSLVLIFALGVLAGVISAVWRGTLVDAVVTVGTLVLYSVPAFWLALMLVLLLAYRFPLLPATGMTGVGAEYLAPGAQLWDRLLHLILPAVALGVAPAAGVARYVRASMLEALGQDYVRTARAKGLSEARVVLVHALRNAMLPMVTLLGLYVPFLFSGSVLIETIFAWPGMGQLIVRSIENQDFPVVLGNAVLFTFAVIGGNLLADVLYALVDPRIRVR